MAETGEQNLEKAKAAFDSVDSSLTHAARTEINSSNWHYIRESTDTAMLVSVILDFLQSTKCMFTSQAQISTLCDQIESSMEG